MINKRLVKTVDGSIKMVWQNVAVQWAGLLCNVVIIFTLGFMLSRALYGGLSASGIAAALAMVLACVVARFFAARQSAQLSHAASERVKLQLRHAIYEKLLRLGPSYHQKVGTSEAVQMAVEGVDQLETYFGKYLPQLFYSLLAPVTLFILLAFISLPAAAVLLACVPLIPISIMAVQKFAKKLLARYWGSYTTLGDSFLENLQGLTTLKIYGSDEAKNSEMNVQAENFRKVTMRVLIMQLNSITLMDLIAYGGAALGIIVAVNQFLAGNIDFWGCFCIILLASEFFIPLRLLGSFFHIAMNGMAASEKIFHLLDTEENSPGTICELQPEAGIVMQDIVCSYDSQRTILDGIQFTAQKGITAIVGESGCGKSTLAALVSGQLTPCAGTVQLGGVKVDQLDTAALMAAVTLVPHNAYLFKGSVRDNLAMADPSATDEEMWQVLDRVKLRAFLENAQGLDTAIEEAGANFSGGQRQRLALARAILHDSPLYVFDEATSNIDVESENDIMEVIWEMGKTKTVLLITHRLANAVASNNIYVMRGGVFVEQGQHQTLLAQQGHYAQMYAAQHKLENQYRKEATNA